MTEDWRFYPCTMGENPATVAFDFGVHEGIDALPKGLLRLRIRFTDPDHGGMPKAEEYEVLNAVEDHVRRWVAEHGGRQVGRITVDGHSHLVSYVNADEGSIFALRKAVEEAHGYVLGWNTSVDPDRLGYWQDLYPTVDDWQVMADLQVIEQLHQAGIDLHKPCRVEHLALFVTGMEARAFAEWAEAVGYDNVRTGKPAFSGGEHPVGFVHEGPPGLHEISGHTLRLRAQTEKMGGRYDGWGAQVETGG